METILAMGVLGWAIGLVVGSLATRRLNSSWLNPRLSLTDSMELSRQAQSPAPAPTGALIR